MKLNPASDPRKITEHIQLVDGFRNFGNHGSHYKEWMHFCVFSKDVNVLVNFSVVQERGRLKPRLTLLIERQELWLGDINPADDAIIKPTQVQFSANNCSLSFENGAFHIFGTIPEKKVTARFRLRPLVPPVQTPSINAGNGNLKWLCVPRCAAEGYVSIDNIIHHFDGAPGYHDHNWGNFEWSGNFSWRWGYFTFGHNLSVIVSRVLDEHGHQVISDSFIVSQDGNLNDFRGHKVTHLQRGLFQKSGSLTVPPITALAIKPNNVSIAREYEVIAADQENRLTLTYSPSSLATIGMPSGERGTHISTISELGCSASLTGTLRGININCTGTGILEITGRG